LSWIEFHATRIIRLKKFHDLRKEMGWSTAECLGNLGLFWGQTLEVCEQGEVTGWTGEYLASLMGFGTQVSEKMLKALGTHGWFDYRGDRVFVHDWIDYAGSFLRGKYAGDNRERLVEIWALHGRTYGKPIGNQLETNSTLPNHTLPNLTKPNKPLFVPTASGLELAELLKVLILVNNPTANIPKDLNKWALEADKMMRLEKRPLEEARRVMEWCQQDSFWKINILSMGKFREKYDQLKLKMEAKNAKTQGNTAGLKTAATVWDNQYD